mmetsp:Transcript_132347/g.423484  ORF Transcript_132347/g.423484 Transcript_132347/m.423484 type:complete len:230 (-) Transcript_132347:500-1189(-)
MARRGLAVLPEGVGDADGRRSRVLCDRRQRRQRRSRVPEDAENSALCRGGVAGMQRRGLAVPDLGPARRRQQVRPGRRVQWRGLDGPGAEALGRRGRLAVRVTQLLSRGLALGCALVERVSLAARVAPNGQRGLDADRSSAPTRRPLGTARKRLGQPPRLVPRLSPVGQQDEKRLMRSIVLEDLADGAQRALPLRVVDARLVLDEDLDTIPHRQAQQLLAPAAPSGAAG